MKKLSSILILGSLPKSNSNKKLYNTIIEVSNEFAESVKSPIDTASFNGSERERYKQAFQTVADAQLVIGEQSSPSTGQGMEIRECAILNKPLIVVAKKGSKVSGLVKGCPITRVIIYYDDLNDLEMRLSREIEKYF